MRSNRVFSQAFVALSVGVALFSATAAHAQSVHNGSQASALSTAGLSAAVAFVPLSVAIGGSQFSVLTAGHLSRLLSEETQWIVEQVSGTGPTREVQLRATKSPTVMVVGVPEATVVRHRVEVRTQVQFERIGDQGFVLKQGVNTLGVMLSEEAQRPHSVKK